MSHLVCKSCKKAFPLDQPRWRCECGSLLDIEWASTFDLEAISRRKPTMWRYREAIPIQDEAHIVSFDEGLTPLVPVDFGGVAVWLKQDQLFPTGSYKDRGASVLISKIVELGVERVVEDSSGNAGCAVAAYCARAGVDCAIYVPDSTSVDKLAQVRAYGAELHRIPGSREDTARAVYDAAQHVYYASHSWNPFFFHGTKTWAFEVCEQLGWQSPDTVVLPVGNGTLLLGAWIGFRELHQAGVVERVPRIVAIQSAACAPLHQAWLQGLDNNASIVKQDTLAEGIAIASPIRGPQILEAVRESGGEFLLVTDGEISASLRAMCRRGFYVEPTSAATTAGVAKYVRGARQSEVIVSTLTGHGLKATAKMTKIAEGKEKG
jgi:threonine synthase